MASKKEIKVIIETLLKNDKFKKELTKTNKGIKTQGGFLSKLMGGYTLLAGVLTGVVATAFVKVINKAKDFEEANSKFGVVFKNNSKEANAMRKELVNAYGFSTAAATEMLSSIQDFLVPMGLARKEATGLSGKFSILARDLASFYNVGIEDVLSNIKSGLTGMAIPMRKYGADLTQAGLQQQLLKDGINKTVSELTRAEKATLIYRKIVNDTKDAQGDWIRTQKSVANTMVQIKAISEDVQLAIGQELLGAIGPTIREFGKFVKTAKFMQGLSKALDVVRIGFNLVSLSIRATKVILWDFWFIPVMQAFKGLTRVIKAFIEKDWKGAWEATKQMGKDTAGSIKNVAKGFKTDVMDISDAIKDLINERKTLSIQGTDEIVTDAKEKADMLLEINRSLYEKLIAGLKKFSEEDAKEWKKRVDHAKEYGKAVSSITGDLLAIEKNKLDTIDEADTEARNKQKSKIVEIAKINKRVSQATAIIDSAGAILKTMASVPWPLNIPLAIAQGIAGAIQIAKIESEPIPSFNVGTDKVLKDQLANVHKGERIIPASMNPMGVTNEALMNSAFRGMSMGGLGGNIQNTTTNAQKFITLSGVTINSPNAENMLDQLEELAENTNSRILSR